jgi:hypothetical protein
VVVTGVWLYSVVLTVHRKVGEEMQEDFAQYVSAFTAEVVWVCNYFNGNPYVGACWYFNVIKINAVWIR